MHIYTCIHTTFNSSVLANFQHPCHHLCMQLSVHLSIHVYIQSSIHLCIHPSVHLYVHTAMHPHTHPATVHLSLSEHLLCVRRAATCWKSQDELEKSWRRGNACRQQEYGTHTESFLQGSAGKALWKEGKGPSTLILAGSWKKQDAESGDRERASK